MTWSIPELASPCRASARPTSSRVTRSAAAIPYRRTPVDDWSFRERPVWSLPATSPTSSPSIRSTTEWMSSSVASSRPCRSMRSATRCRPSTSAAASSAASTCAAPNARAQATLPATSSRQSRRSMPRLRLNGTISRAISPSKRPPQSALALALGPGPVSSTLTGDKLAWCSRDPRPTGLAEAPPRGGGESPAGA